MGSVLQKLKQLQTSSPPTKQQQRIETLKKYGVQNPHLQTSNVGRSTMLSQIENFDRSNLKPLESEQRFIVSPHKSISNLMNNTRGMSMFAMSQGHKMIRPVFKDEDQRSSFHQEAIKRLSTITSGTTEHKVMSQLKEWSHLDNAMLNFDNVNTKRSHPIVYTQGHGMPGVTSISSDDKHEKRVSGNDMAKLLTKMNLPKVSQVRANSCFSGTEHWVPNNPTVRQHHQEQTVDVHHAGNWSNTFAGSLQEGLDKRSGSHNRVRGYMGPTSQNPSNVQKLGVGGILHQTKSRGMRTKYATKSQYIAKNTLNLQRSDTKRYGKF
ncbi:hypothetical protein [Aliikangiella coralliicola]|uniref:Uncharacterized protein n=1 Tax=Aliikangiella coralliicola TaxID=2592383 RepID=A0A545UIT4_9GAMM|nr:hypothetical protein [Aliikangiella coralliicola]TQV89376.1 hypothetical protein FLL46_00390 [Aliikangiella coralliicola]